MPLKFTANVTNRVPTLNLERQLLHALLSDRLNLQRLIGKHRSEFFTTQSRLFIYDCIMRTFNEKRTTLSPDQFEFEIKKRYDLEKDKTRVDDLTSEFTLIEKTAVTESTEVIIQNLEEVQLANSTEALIRDAYKELENGNYTEAADMLKRKSIDLGTLQKENRIYNLHKDSDDWFEEVKKRHDHPEIYAGIPTGFQKFDEKTGGLFPAELTVVFGLSGKGKSTLMKAMACNIRKSGRNVLHCGNEENEFQMRSKYMSADSGALYSVFKKGTYTDEQFLELKKYSDNERNAKGNIFIYEFPQQTDATWIERAYRQLEMQGIKIDVIIVDYLDLMKPCEKAYSENDEGGKVTSDLKQVAINCNVPLITATQAGIQSEKQEKKERPFLNQSDVFGTKRKVHSANTLIGIVNQTATAQAQELPEEQRQMHHLVLCVPKNRDGAVFVFRQKMHAPTGRFFEEDGDSKDEAVLQEVANQALQMCDETLAPGQMVSEISMEALNKAKLKDLEREMIKLRAEIAEDERKKAEQEKANAESNADMSSNEQANNEPDPFLDGAPSSSSVEVKEEEQPADVEQNFLPDDVLEEQKIESEEDDQPEQEEESTEGEEPDSQEADADESEEEYYENEPDIEKEKQEESRRPEPKAVPEPDFGGEPEKSADNGGDGRIIDGQVGEDKQRPVDSDKIGESLKSEPPKEAEPLTPFDDRSYEPPKVEKRDSDSIGHKMTLDELIALKKKKKLNNG